MPLDSARATRRLVALCAFGGTVREAAYCDMAGATVEPAAVAAVVEAEADDTSTMELAEQQAEKDSTASALKQALATETPEQQSVAASALMGEETVAETMVSLPSNSLPGGVPPKLKRAESGSTIARTHTLCSCRYLGAARMDAPASSTELCRNIARLKETTRAMPVVICIPRLSGGRIHLMEVATNTVIKTFAVRSILLCASGTGQDADAMGFTIHVTRCLSSETSATSTDRDSSPSDPAATPPVSVKDVFHAHLFVFDSEEKRQEAVLQFAQAFGSLGDSQTDPLLYNFELTLGVSEPDQKGCFVYCPFQKVKTELRLACPRFKGDTEK